MAKTVKEAEAENVKAEEAKEEPAVDEAVKEEPVKEEASQKSGSKAAGSRPAKESAQTTVYIQYHGRQITQEDLIKSAKDIWKYDLKRKAAELTSIELYVKTEDDMVYYVMNGDVKGSFSI